MQFQEKFEMITSKKYKNSMSWLAHKFEEKQGEGEGGGGCVFLKLGLREWLYQETFCAIFGSKDSKKNIWIWVQNWSGFNDYSINSSTKVKFVCMGCLETVCAVEVLQEYT